MTNLYNKILKNISFALLEALNFEIDDNGEIALSKNNIAANAAEKTEKYINTKFNISEVFNGLYGIKKPKGFELEYNTIIPEQYILTMTKSVDSTYSKNIKSFLYSKNWYNPIENIKDMYDKRLIFTGIQKYFENYNFDFEDWLYMKADANDLACAANTPENLNNLYQTIINNNELMHILENFNKVIKNKHDLQYTRDILMSPDNGMVYINISQRQFIFLSGLINYIDKIKSKTTKKDVVQVSLNKHGIKTLNFSNIELSDFNGKPAYTIKFAHSDNFIPTKIFDFKNYMLGKSKFFNTYYNPENDHRWDIENCKTDEVYESLDEELTIRIYFSNYNITSEEYDYLSKQKLVIFDEQKEKNKLGFILIVKEK